MLFRKVIDHYAMKKTPITTTFLLSGIKKLK